MDGVIIAGLIVLAILGMPLFAVFGAASLLLFADLENTSITGAANDVFSEKFADSPLMVTIPLFIFAGYIMAESGTPRRLVRMSRAFFGWMPGGLAMVALVASAFFTTFTGGSGITIVAIGGLLYPALIQERYGEKFSLGLVTTGGSLGLLFPPSLPLVLYGVVAGVLIEKLFLAGIIPGIITMVALGAYAFVFGVRSKLPRTRFEGREARSAFWEAKWEVLLPVVLLGGLYSGVLRIHEAAAFAAIYALVIEVWIYKDVSFRRDLPRIIRESTTMFGAILAILATAIGFTAFLIQAQVPMKILEAMETILTSPFLFLLALNVFLLLVGMLMDIFSAIVVVVPLIVPIALHFGIDPYHLGIVFLLNLEIGYLTPPVGLNLFISSFRFDKPVTLLYRAVLPFIGLLLIALVLTTYVPAMSTWLPSFIETEEMPDMEQVPMEPADGEPAVEGDIDLDDLLGEDMESGEMDLDGLEAGEGGGATLDDLEGANDFTLDDLEGGGDDLTLDDLEGGGADALTLDDLEEDLGADRPTD